MATSTTKAADKAADSTQTASDIADKHLEEQAKLRDKNTKVLIKADVRDRLLLALAAAWIDHPSADAGDAARLSALSGELSEDMGVNLQSSQDQIIQHPEVRAAERQANRELAVAGAIAAGLVPEDHRPGDEKTAEDKVEEAHPTSATPVTVSVPAGMQASALKPDKPADPTKK